MDHINFKVEDYSYHMSEEIKNLRTNIKFAGEDKRVIMVTSCIQGEGKSGTSFKLARSFTELNKKVLLIDADLRASVFTGRVDGVKPKYGLTHFLSGQVPFQDIVCSTNVHGLYACFSGPMAPTPIELISRPIFENKINALREKFDYIIIDTPPIGIVIDAAIIARFCDASILVVQSGGVNYKFLQNVKRKLEDTGCLLVGVVLTKVTSQHRQKYSQKYYAKYE